MNRDPYRRIARWYDRLIEPVTIPIGEDGRKMFPPVNGVRVLEVGCGTGTHLKFYQKAGCSIFGIDLSPAMLAIAREKLGERSALLLGDASQMPYSDGAFDLVVIIFALHEMFASVRTAVISETKRVLKKDGRILIIDYHPEPVPSPEGRLVKGVMTFIEAMAGRTHFKNYRDFLARKGLPPLIDAHGLSVIDRKFRGRGNLGLFLLGPE
ncbi:MAG: class I SAM-dependent methyltransferase [Pseudomonadota bacterium]